MNSTASIRRLSEAGREKLIRILGLLGSTHQGERDAAALAAIRLLQQFDLSWHDVVAQSAPADAGPIRLAADWRALARACLRQKHLLTAWEEQFVRELSAYRRHPSPRQLEA